MVALYSACYHEVETKNLFSYLRKQKIKVSFPKVFDGKTLLFYQVDDLSYMKPGFYSIMEPVTLHKKVALKKIDLMVIPGVVFDEEGFRLGYGKGFYDRALKHFKNLKVGFAFNFQKVKKIPRQKHDVAVNVIVTEKKIYKLSSFL